MKTAISTIFVVALIVAGFKSVNQETVKSTPLVLKQNLEFKELKKPDAKLVKELKTLNLKTALLKKEVSSYKTQITVVDTIVKIDSTVKDSVIIKKRFIPRVIDRIR